MKSNYQWYIESENFGQSRIFVAFKITIEDSSVYRRVSIFSAKRHNQNLQTRALNEE